MRFALPFLVLVACGDNAPPVPDAAPPLERCAALSCAFTICGSCAVCGQLETTCECYQAAPVGVDAPHVPCAP